MAKNQKNNIEQRLKFLEKIDEFKSIVRYTNVKNRKERENDAEHSWHMAMWFLVFGDLFEGKIDKEKVLKMILIHDLPEIYAGDSFGFIYDKNKKKREAKAAVNLFKGLPLKISKEFIELWKEYESGKTKEAKIAKAMDKLQPFLQSIATKGKLWKTYKVTYDMLENSKRKHMVYDKNIMAIYENLLKKSKRILQNRVN